MARDDQAARCPACDAAEPRRLGLLTGHGLRRCPRCGHSFLEVRELATIEHLYNDHYAGFRVDPVFHEAARRLLVEQITPVVAPPARLLDVGCGNGDFLTVARDAGYRVMGIDVSPAAGERCRAQGLDVWIGDLRRFADPDGFDLITFWDVVEHLPDPHSFLQHARGLLRPGGAIVIKTPLTTQLTVRLAAALPPLGRGLVQAPSHVQYFERAGLATLLRRAGFDRQRWLEARPMRSPATGGRLRRRVSRRVAQGLHALAGDGNLLVIAHRA